MNRTGRIQRTHKPKEWGPYWGSSVLFIGALLCSPSQEIELGQFGKTVVVIVEVDGSPISRSCSVTPGGEATCMKTGIETIGV